MTERAERPSPEVILIQRELDKAREQLKQQEILANHHRNLSEKNLQDEVEFYQTPILLFYIIDNVYEYLTEGKQTSVITKIRRTVDANERNE